MVMTTSVLERKANKFHEAGRYRDALRFANRLCQRKAGDFEACQLRTMIHLELDDKQQALQDALHAWGLMPDRVDAMRLRSRAWSANGMHGQAIEELQKVVEQSSPSAAVQVQLGYEFQQLQDYAKAIRCYHEAIRLDPECSPAWNRCATVYAMAKRAEFRDGTQARRFAARAVRLAKTEQDQCHAWDSFGAALAELGDFTRARKAAKKALGFTEDPKAIRSIKQRINCYKRRERIVDPIGQLCAEPAGEAPATGS
jgi:tetratricopeptide (TPR) repeat protein